MPAYCARLKSLTRAGCSITVRNVNRGRCSIAGTSPSRRFANLLLFLSLAALLVSSSGQSQPAEPREETVRRRIPFVVQTQPAEPPAGSDENASPSSDSGTSSAMTGEGLPGSPSPSTASTAASAASAEPVAPSASAQPGPSPAAYYDLWVLAPALIAIILAILTQQVVPSLFIGILTAGTMLCYMNGITNPVDVLVATFSDYVLGVFIPVDLSDTSKLEKGYEHLQVIVFTQLIGGMIGIIGANGGTQGMVARVTHLMKDARRGQLGALAGGIIIFFDDYANALILGPAMRPVFDRLKLSRAKLAYIVDSTAAPVASLFIGTWLAAEINFLDEGFSALGDSRPAFLENMTGSTSLWGSLPYRTYAWLTLFFVFLVGLTGRDFGPMKNAEAEALAAPEPPRENDNSTTDHARYWYLGFLPVFTLVAMTIALLLLTGRAGCRANGVPISFDTASDIWNSVQSLLAQANSYKALMYSGFAAVTIAAISTVLSRRLPLSKTMDAMTAGMQRIFGAQIVLILAWGLSTSVQDLQLGEVARIHMQAMVDRGWFAVPLLPTVVFLTACLISFATGTSWGTMSILCPTTIAVASGLLSGLPVEQAMPLYYASIGAVLTGAVFGDHCSPISDTTVLSAMASECDLSLHVRTQLPYAIVTATVGLLSTDILDYILITTQPEFYASYWNVYFGTALAAVLLTIIVLLFGRKPVTPMTFLRPPPVRPARPA